MVEHVGACPALCGDSGWLITGRTRQGFSRDIMSSSTQLVGTHDNHARLPSRAR